MAGQGRLAATIYDAAADPERTPKRVFVLDAQAGAGKTFVLNHIARRIAINPALTFVLCIGVSSQAALQFGSHGQVLHQSINLDFAGARYYLTEYKRDALRDAALIVLDEVFLAHRRWVSALDQACRDATGVDALFGGKVVVCAGDRGQQPTIVKPDSLDDDGDEELTGADDETAAVFAAHPDRWFEIHRDAIEQLTLEIDAAQPPPRFLEPEWATTLVGIRDGSVTAVAADEFGGVVRKNEETIAEILPELASGAAVMLCSRHTDIKAWNDRVLKENPTQLGRFVEYKGNDTYAEAHLWGEVEFGAAVFRNICPHALRLRVGSRVKFTARHGRQTKNGRATVVRLGKDCVGVRMVDSRGNEVGPIEYVGRITSKTTFCGMEMQRHQFPLVLSYAETWLSCQGTTYSPPTKVYIDVSSDVPHCHGQLYVLLSRARSRLQSVLLRGEEDLPLDGVPNVVRAEFLHGAGYEGYGDIDAEASDLVPIAGGLADGDAAAGLLDYVEDVL
eukprot:g20086.t1